MKKILVGTLAVWGIALLTPRAFAGECEQSAFLFARKCRVGTAMAPAWELAQYADRLVCDEVQATRADAQQAIVSVGKTFGIGASDFRKGDWYTAENCGKLTTEAKASADYRSALSREWNRSCGMGYDRCVAAERRAAATKGTLSCALDELGVGQLQVSVHYAPKGSKASASGIVDVSAKGPLECEKPLSPVAPGGVAVIPCTRIGAGTGTVDVELENGVRCAHPAQLKASQASTVSASTRTCSSTLPTYLFDAGDGRSLLSPLLSGLCSQCMDRNVSDTSRGYAERIATCAIWSFFSIAEHTGAGCSGEGQSYGIASGHQAMTSLHCLVGSGYPPPPPPFGYPPAGAPLQPPAASPVPLGPITNSALLVAPATLGSSYYALLVGGSTWVTPPYGRWRPPPDLLSESRWLDVLARFAAGAPLSRAMEIAVKP